MAIAFVRKKTGTRMPYTSINIQEDGRRIYVSDAITLSRLTEESTGEVRKHTYKQEKVACRGFRTAWHPAQLTKRIILSAWGNFATIAARPAWIHGITGQSTKHTIAETAIAEGLFVHACG